MMASYCRPACVCVGRRGLFLSRVCICECVFSWLLFMFRIILVISENCVKSSERASSVCCFRGCSFMICVCVCHNLSVCVCVCLFAQAKWYQMRTIDDRPVIIIIDRWLQWKKALLYSAGQGNKLTEGATVAHRETNCCVCVQQCVWPLSKDGD